MMYVIYVSDRQDMESTYTLVHADTGGVFISHFLDATEDFAEVMRSRHPSATYTVYELVLPYTRLTL